MIVIACPHCGPRNSNEFRHTGEAPDRPDPNAATRSQWRSYLYDKRNPCGWATETWYHAMGCRQFIAVQRHRTTNETRSASTDGPPEQPTQGGGDHADVSGLSGRMS